MPPAPRPALNPNLYLRDPQGTALGRRLLAEGVLLLDRIGLEAFTFKKLAAVLGSTEASLYRYFENKHQLLTYLASWHWGQLRQRVRQAQTPGADPRQRLRQALAVLCEPPAAGPNPAEGTGPAGPDEAALYRVVQAEASKAYLTKSVDDDNRAGLFVAYKGLAAELVLVVQALNPTYRYPHALVSTLLEAARKQPFFAQHLPSLTETSPVLEFLEHLALAALA